ncbi:zinc transporter SLC39A7 isoform X9 [Taeniopygia guttata]|uniref:zinc transporter SLC39A7 isoform X9 n=1 Tax=Taeniopygia guttata TaxID=59729 RepID=UPI003BB85CE2
MGLPLLILTLGVLLGLGEGHRDPPPISGHPHPHLYGPPKTKTRPDTAQVWLQTMGAALGVSLAPHLLLLLVPADSGSPRRRGLLRLLLSFAAGGLLGDAFLHLIPHALVFAPTAPHDHHEGHGHSHHGHAPHDHHEGHGHSHHGHVFAPTAPHDHHEGHGHSQHGHAPHDHHEGHGHSHHGHAPHDHHEGHGHSHHGHAPHDHHEGHGHSHHGHGAALWVGLWVLAGIVAFLTVELLVRHGHGHGHAPKSKHSSSEDEADGDARDTKGTKGTKATGATTGTKATKDTKDTKDTKATKAKRGRSHHGDRAAMAASGYLNLAADAAHNFTDGLALGAAFWGSPARGALTALAVLLHELPHELGDMALLLRAGCSKGQAMLLQLLTALAALAGAACSLLAEGSGAGAISGILPFTAGGFIYLGTVSVLPEILHDSGAGQALLQLLALLAGVAMMLLIAYYE